ncbi:MAG: hypothetical protein L6437_13235 [Kiritimatiellae bacterium]|nr:hypothetical protein [Kiritimatiellia bacterium]
MKKYFKYQILFIILFCVSFFANSAEVKMSEESVDGKKVFRLENYRVNLVISPERGGAVVSYRDKLGGNVELIQQTKYGALCMDHFQAQSWPGELLEVPYEAKVIKNEPGECVIQVSRTATGSWGGSEYPELAGIILEKTYILKADSPALESRVKLTAPAKSSKLAAYWSQCIFWAGGTYDSDNDWTFRPSVRGVRAKSKDKLGHFGFEDFLADFTAGWIALIDKKSKSGLAVISDYDDVKFLYVNQANHTVEHMFNITWLPAGGSAEFYTKIIPVAGLDNVVAANEDFVAGCKMSSDNRGSGKISLDFVRSANAPKEVKLDISIKNIMNPAMVAKAGTIKVEGIGDTVKSAELAFSGAGADPLVLQATGEAVLASGTAGKISFEEFFCGAYRWADNITTDMATPFYKGEKPAQKLKLQKPQSISLRKPGKFNVWFVDGLLDDYLRISDSVNLVSGVYDGGRVRKCSFVISSSFGTKLTWFPYDYEEMLSYNYMVFGGVKADALGPIGIEMISDYQKAGGGIVMLGSPLSYGNSGLAGTKFAELLPVKIKGHAFDIKDVAGAEIKVEQNLPMLEDLDWNSRPAVRFIHEVEVKDWGKVVLTAGGKPFLVIGETTNKARVACLMGTPMGTLQDEKGLPFWKWNDWPYLMRQIFWWVSKHDEKFKSRAY